MPAYGFVKKNRVARDAARRLDHRFRHPVPERSAAGRAGSNNSIGTYLSGQLHRQFRVPGVPLYLKDLNCGCIDPTQDTVLNPAAWMDQAAGVFGTRHGLLQRLPRPAPSRGIDQPRQALRDSRTDGASAFGRSSSTRFNRMEVVSDPARAARPTRPRAPTGLLTGGFGYMNYTAIASNSVGGTLPAPRTGQIVARFEF